MQILTINDIKRVGSIVVIDVKVYLCLRFNEIKYSKAKNKISPKGNGMKYQFLVPVIGRPIVKLVQCQGTKDLILAQTLNKRKRGLVLFLFKLSFRFSTQPLTFIYYIIVYTNMKMQFYVVLLIKFFILIKQ
jgi:hypothetical protein